MTKWGKGFLSRRQTQSLMMCLQLAEEEVGEPFCAYEEPRQEQPELPLLFRLHACVGTCVEPVARGQPKALPAVQCNFL